MILGRRGLIAYPLALLVVVLDQLSKWWVLDVYHLPIKSSVPVGLGVHLTFVPNTGVSLGLLQSSGLGRWLLVVFALAVVIGLIVLAARSSRAWTAIGYGLVIGGALGNNLIDRVRLGWVVDFLDFNAWRFPWIFNIADAAITVGVVLLLLDSFLAGRKVQPA